MPRALRIVQFVVQAAILGLALAFIATRLWPARFAAPAPVGAESAELRNSYAATVAHAVPAVVNIYTGRVVEQRGQTSLGDPQLDKSAGISPYASRRLERSVGAGVLVRPDGYVLTNNHVILGADNILVGLSDGRLMAAKVVGKDFETDLAVLKVEGDGYPVLRPPADPRVAVGDVVLAIGNPLGMGQSVTLGIVSAIGRNLDVSAYEDFIQTDAAINFGSSGGALVNASGALIGINTATGRNLGAQGISFAIPAEAALKVLDEIVAQGFVTRGWMGTEYTNAANAGNGATRGAAIVGVLKGGPAHVAGLLPGDVVTRFNGDEIDDQAELRGHESRLKPGTEVEVEGVRDGVPFKMKLALIQRRIPGKS